MKVLKATQTQYNSLNGFQKGVSRLEFFKDKNDNWVVGLQVLEDLDFAAIYSDLERLEQIEYAPFDDII
jgi:hypothetical protein